MDLMDDMTSFEEDENLLKTLSTTRSSGERATNYVDEGNRTSTIKEESKRKIYDQANLVKRGFPSMILSEQNKLTQQSPSTRDSSSLILQPSAFTSLNSDLGETKRQFKGIYESNQIISPISRDARFSSLCPGGPTTSYVSIKSNTTVKRLRLDPTENCSPLPSNSDFSLDDSILREHIWSPGEDAHVRPSSTKEESNLTSTLNFHFPDLFNPKAGGATYISKARPSETFRYDEEGETATKRPFFCSKKTRQEMNKSANRTFQKTTKTTSLSPTKSSAPPHYSKITLNCNDVVCDSQGIMKQNTVGNRRLSVLFDLYQESYRNATYSVERFGTAQKIVNSIREAFPPGRVIEMDQSTGLGCIVKDIVATKIIERALRERMACNPFGGKVA